MNKKDTIHIKTLVEAPLEIVWKCYTSPEDIIKWNSASEDWHTTYAMNDLVVGGRFLSRMEAKDGSVGFDFSGVYLAVNFHEYIEYKLDDERKVKVTFLPQIAQTLIKVDFEAEDSNPIEMQKMGWQAILDHFKRYINQTYS